MLSTRDENTVFGLEGIEDIDYILTGNNERRTVHIQLKYSTIVQNASFMYSVLKNFLEAYLIDRNREFKLVYDFSVAKGHMSKLLEGKLDTRTLKYWQEVIERIKKETVHWKWDDFDFDEFISKISYESIRKTALEDYVEKMLIENYGITTNNVQLFANSLKIFCLEKMENRDAVKVSDIEKCIETVKFDISKGVQNPAHSWIKKIDFEISSKEKPNYFEGKKATPIDIACGLPVSRPIIEKELESSVNNYNVTIIKSSSGQGKTTLAYRMQYILKEEYTPYQITCCDEVK